MYTYLIRFTVGDSQVCRQYKCTAESEGEAIERFEEYAEYFDDGYDFVNITELPEA